MQYIQFDTVKALGDELRRQAFTHRVTVEEAVVRAGPIGRLRHVTGHVLIATGQAIAHGARQSAPH